MRRPKPKAGATDAICFLIPARNEAHNLDRVVRPLRAQGAEVIVFDDDSSDGTAEVAAAAGANVVQNRTPLEAGWSGKNRACHQLALAASESSSADWWCFLDADVEPGPEFVGSLQALVAERGQKVPIFTGFPTILPGRGIEPLFLAWVGWSLLAENPFGLVARTGKGHNMFTNGQLTLYRADVYREHWPNEAMKGRILEDVAIGRTFGKKKVPIEVVNLTHAIKVRMYDHWRETLDGMSKNSYEIAGSAVGSVLLAGWFAVLALAWVGGFFLSASLGWLPLLLFTLSGLFVALAARTPLWPMLFMPVNLLIASVTIMRSLMWRKQGKTTWKGRVYSNLPSDPEKP
jgi:hypothetical protein